MAPKLARTTPCALPAVQRGALELVTFTTEPECHETVGGIRLTPDAYVELAYYGTTLTSWLEVDRCTEHSGTIQEKCTRYWKAFISGQFDVYAGDKQNTYCKTCKAKRTWVKCANCRGRGPTWTTTCKFKCTEGYKCEKAPTDPYHPVGEVK